MNILVDADACPSAVRDIIVRAAERRHIKTTFIANQKISVPDNDLFEMIVVEQGPDEADDRIVELAVQGDLVVSEDIPLADRVIARGATVITTRGVLYTGDNIKGRLATRDLLETLRSSGIETGGPPPFTQKDRRMFADQLDRYLAKHC